MAVRRTYTVVLHRDEGYKGYWVEVPALVGCVSQGKTKQKALRNIKEAIALHIQSMREDGVPIPVEQSSIVEVAA
ncbi:MAG: type II toxin-antitoxin system HicB family antitoxin [Dehalococcoidia bacterium]|nr:type II toxin-antitoxin system HicB family antitoxin [Dehalococcoidia bacterium]